MIGANIDAVFARFCAAMGEPEMAHDPGFATDRARGERQGELDTKIAAWTSGITVDALEALMVEHNVPSGRVYRAPDMLADPQFAAREALVEVDSPRWGKFAMQNSFPRLSDTPGGIRTLAPGAVGEHNEDVYRDLLGMHDAMMQQLKAARHI